MNPSLDQTSCNMCRLCYRRNTPQCNDACRRCGIALFSEDEVNGYPFSQQTSNNTVNWPSSKKSALASRWPYPPNYPYAYPSHSPTSKSVGRLYYNYPRVTNQYYPSMLPYGNYYGSLYRPSITYF